VVSLDTNERSLDGVFVREGEGVPVKASFPQVAVIQLKHHDRRKRLQTKKSHDRRTLRRLCRREGKREHDRVEYQMHQVANAPDRATRRPAVDGRRQAYTYCY
jgi:hypothetical protein